MIKQFVFGALIAGSLGACYAEGTATVASPQPVVEVEVDAEPPAPQVYVAAPRAGYIYIDGRYRYEHGRYIWHEGYYERERSGYVWEPGRWSRGRRGHVWVEGRWRHR